MANLRSMQTLLIDGDGVLWHDDEPVPGLNPLFRVLDRRGIDWALLTNNATRTAAHYVEKLNGFGIRAGIQNVYTSTTVAAAYLRERFEPGTGMFIVGETGLAEALRGAGFDVFSGEQMPDKPIAAVVVAMDRQLTYAKLDVATHLIRNGAEFIGTNPDRTIPTPAGLSPGAGTMQAAVAAATDVQPVILGKPEPAIFEAAMAHFDARKETTFMLGDRLETDILGAVRAGIGSILVLTGASTREMIAERDYAPDYVFPSIKELAEELESYED